MERSLKDIKKVLTNYRFIFYFGTLIGFILVLSYLKDVLEGKVVPNMELIGWYVLGIFANMFIVLWVEGFMDTYLEGMFGKVRSWLVILIIFLTLI